MNDIHHGVMKIAQVGKNNEFSHRSLVCCPHNQCSVLVFVTSTVVELKSYLSHNFICYFWQLPKQPKAISSTSLKSGALYYTSSICSAGKGVSFKLWALMGLNGWLDRASEAMAKNVGSAASTVPNQVDPHLEFHTLSMLFNGVTTINRKQPSELPQAYNNLKYYTKTKQTSWTTLPCMHLPLSLCRTPVRLLLL